MVAGDCRRPAPAARECTLFPNQRGTQCWRMYNYGDSLFVPSFRALDCSNFIGISGWLYRQFFATDYITMLKVHWSTITWYSSHTSCFKIFVLTKLSGYNLGAIRYNTSWKGGDSVQISHGQPVFTIWRVHRHKNLAFTNLVCRLVLIFKALWQGDSVSKYKPT